MSATDDVRAAAPSTRQRGRAVWAARMQRAPLLARGLWLRRRRAVEGGTRLMLGQRVRLNAQPPGARLELGERVRLYHDVGIYIDAPDARVRVGDDTYVNRRSEICAQQRIEIGARCAISWDVMIADSDYHAIEGSPPTLPVRVGDDVWVGAGAKILKGVTIGDGAVVAAGAVVIGDVPPATLVAGIPARVIREQISWQTGP